MMNNPSRAYVVLVFCLLPAFVASGSTEDSADEKMSSFMLVSLMALSLCAMIFIGLRKSKR